MTFSIFVEDIFDGSLGRLLHLARMVMENERGGVWSGGHATAVLPLQGREVRSARWLLVTARHS